MQNFKISVPTVCYFIAGTIFPEKFKAESDLLNLVESNSKNFLFNPAAIADKEGGIIGNYRIDSSKFPAIAIKDKNGFLVGEVDLRKALPEKGIKEPYICFYLPERKKEAGERAFLFSSNEEDFNLLKELAFPFAGD